jgi:Mn2+/Fe2+ NRAMP family transporter
MWLRGQLLRRTKGSGSFIVLMFFAVCPEAAALIPERSGPALSLKVLFHKKAKNLRFRFPA